MYKHLLKECCISYEFIMLDDCKMLRIEPRGLSGYMKLYYTNINSLAKQLKQQFTTSYIFMSNL